MNNTTIPKRGIDLESKIVELLFFELKLNPEKEFKLHRELAEKYFKEDLKLKLFY